MRFDMAMQSTKFVNAGPDWADIAEDEIEAGEASLRQILQAMVLGGLGSNDTFALIFIDLHGAIVTNRGMNADLGTISAAALRPLLGTRDFVARLSPTRLGVLLRGEDEPVKLVMALRRALRGLPLGAQLGVSAGHAIYPMDAGSPDALWDHASAMAAKRRGSGSTTGHRGSGPSHIPVTPKPAEVNPLSIPQALRLGDMVIHFQPQFSLRSNRLSGGEALLRWNHPTLGLLNPGRFLAECQAVGFLPQIENWVMASVCYQIAEWRQHGLDTLPVGINVSASNFRALDFVDRVAAILAETGIPGAAITIDVAESTLLEDPAAAEQILRLLLDLGVRVSVDDCSASLSVLTRLAALPLAALKIDPVYVAGIETDTQCQAQIRALIGMARCLGVSVVAKNIETVAQLRILIGLGCDRGQGFMLGRPMAADRFALGMGPAPRKESEQETMRGSELLRSAAR